MRPSALASWVIFTVRGYQAGLAVPLRRARGAAIGREAPERTSALVGHPYGQRGRRRIVRGPEPGAPLPPPRAGRSERETEMEFTRPATACQVERSSRRGGEGGNGHCAPTDPCRVRQRRG